jgi:hypothetical protein
MPHTLISSTFSWDCPFKMSATIFELKCKHKIIFNNTQNSAQPNSKFLDIWSHKNCSRYDRIVLVAKYWYTRIPIEIQMKLISVETLIKRTDFVPVPSLNVLLSIFLISKNYP